MNRRLALVLAATLFVGCRDAATDLGASNASGRPLLLAGPTMGTRYTVKLAGLPSGFSQERLRSGIEEVLAEIDRQMSTWRDDSELSRFNTSSTTDWFPVSPELAEVAAEAKRIHRLSGGAFDVTVKPLTDLWGFGPKGRPERIPTQAEIEAALKRVGGEKIEVRDDDRALRKGRPDMQIVLSAIAKGFAVDRVAAFLDEANVPAYLVEIGGEIRARGDRPDGTAWTIGIERPISGHRTVQKVIRLKDLSMATSGDYRNYYEAAGKRFSHTIDPRTGRPIQHGLASVTVVDERCATADAWATALMVLGPTEGYNLAVERNLAAYFIIRRGDRFVEKTTSRFDELTGPPR